MKAYLYYLINKLYTFVVALLQKSCFLKKKNAEEPMQSGELIVTGCEEIRIELRGLPTSVKVHFEDDVCPVPCNPHHHDNLHFHIENDHERFKHHHNKEHYMLVITWKIQNIRVIKWTVYY